MYVIVLTYIQPTEEIDKQLVAHRNFLDIYFKSGHFFCSGPQVPREGGIIICKAESREAVEAIIAEDPFKIHQLASYQIIEFNAVRFAPQFEAFFK